MAGAKRKPNAKRKPSRSPPPISGTAPRTLLARELDAHRQELAAQNVELRRTNAALLAATERYAELYDGAPSAYFTLDPDSVVVEANLAAADLLGAPRNVLFGRRFADLVVPQLRESFRSFCRGVHTEGGRLSHETLLAVGNRRVPVKIEAARPATRVGQLLLSVTDETERRYLEQERRSLEARTAEAQRLESVGALANGLAHDFNNALAIVLSHADLVLLDDAATDPTREAVAEIRRAGARAADLAKQMLTYAGRGRMRAERVDVSRLIRSMQTMLEASVSKDVDVVYDLAEDLPPVMGESALIQQVIWNLVVNASEAIVPGAGQVMVRTRSHIQTASTDGAPRGLSVLVEVTDDGRGMDELTRRRAFDPFFSTKRAGRGFGLAVVHGNVRTHGGLVAIESHLNRGTSVRVYLPVGGVASEEVRPANDVKVAPSQGNGFVLVVDDEEDVRDAAGMVLERAGYRVCYAKDGVEALALVRRPPAPLAAVLLDVLMPRLDGPATLVELKRMAPNLPVIMTSGLLMDVMAPELAPADAFLPKPFTLSSLLDAVRKVAGQRAEP